MNLPILCSDQVPVPNIETHGEGNHINWKRGAYFGMKSAGCLQHKLERTAQWERRILQSKVVQHISREKGLIPQTISQHFDLLTKLTVTLIDLAYYWKQRSKV